MKILADDSQLAEVENCTCMSEGPSFYPAWQEWAAQMHANGWRQRRCPSCGLYVWCFPQGFTPERS